MATTTTRPNMHALASSLQSLTARNAFVHKTLLRISSSGTADRAKRRRMHDELEEALLAGKTLSREIRDAATSRTNERQHAKLLKQLDKEMRKTQTLVAQLASVEKEMIANLSPTHSQQQQQQQQQTSVNMHEQSFEEMAREPLLDQTQVAMANESAMNAQQNEMEIRMIEEDVVQLNDMFKDLSYLVEEQQDTLDCIEDNIASTATYTRQGLDEVEKAQSYMRKARSRSCKLLMLLLVVTFIAVLVVVEIIKS